MESMKVDLFGRRSWLKGVDIHDNDDAMQQNFTERDSERDECDGLQAAWPDKQSLKAPVLGILADRGFMTSFVYLECSMSSSLFNLCNSGQNSPYRFLSCFLSMSLNALLLHIQKCTSYARHLSTLEQRRWSVGYAPPYPFSISSCSSVLGTL